MLSRLLPLNWLTTPTSSGPKIPANLFITLKNPKNSQERDAGHQVREERSAHGLRPALYRSDGQSERPEVPTPR